MPIPQIWVKQTSNTTGTGTLTFNAPSSGYRGFQAGFSAVSQPVRYVLSREASAIREEGYGIFNGASPGTLTRATVTASTNGGALVSLPAGTTDVYFDFLPGDRAIRTLSSNTTLALADIGNLIRCTPTANINVTLPSIATVPYGMGFLIRNDGTNNSIVTIVSPGSNTINGDSADLLLFVGESVEIFATSTPGWVTTGLPTGPRPCATAELDSTVATADFVLPPGFTRFGVDWYGVSPVNDAVALRLRTSVDGGATFASGLSDYRWVQWIRSSQSISYATESSVELCTYMDATASYASCMGTMQFWVGDGTRRNMFQSRVSLYPHNPSDLNSFEVTAWRAANTVIDAIRFFPETGNFSTGKFVLSVLR